MSAVFGKCPKCRFGLELDAASNTQVEKVREAIIDTVALAASRDRFKVFILDEVHMLSASSFNALLKTIEEPPAHVVFILATTEKHKVPATIVSRCQTFRFRPLTVDEISAHLIELAEAEGIDLSANAAKIIAKNAAGAMRDGLTLLDRAIAYCGDHVDEKAVSEMLGLTSTELLTDAVAALCRKDNAQMHQVFQTLQAEGFDANTFLKDLKNMLGDLFYFSLGQSSEPFDGAKALMEGISSGFLARLTRKLSKLIDEVKFSDNALISAEVGLFTIMDSVLDLDNFIRRLEALERGESLPPSTPSVPPARKPVAKKTQATKSTTHQAVAAPQETAPVPTLDKAISNHQVWDKMMTQFAASPFVYDVLINSSVEFTTENEWTLKFASGKEFYQIPAQNKLTELSEAASQLSGRKITISLGANTLSAAPQKAKVPAAKKSATKNLISEEEPFAKGPFVDEASVPAGQMPEEVKDILEIFPNGELMA